MSYHNVRDKFGRFAKTKKTASSKTKKAKTKEKKVSKTIFNAFLLDNTASMQGKVGATIEGFNSILLTGQQDATKLGINNVEAFALFGSPRKTEFVVKNVKPLSAGRVDEKSVNYSPGEWSTALWMAICTGITSVEGLLKNFPKKTKVIFTIFTDGLNNSAPEYKAMATTLINQKQNDGWVINFVGAGELEQVQRVATSVGIFASNALAYTDNAVGAKEAFNSFNRSRSTYTKAVKKGVESNVGFFSEE